MKKRTLLRFPNFLKKALTLSYDDGVKADEKLIELMKKYQIKGTFNLCSGFMKNADGNGNTNTVSKCLELYKEENGVEVASHGECHHSLAEVASSIAVKDVLNDRINLENIFNKQITGFAYANGSYNADVIDILNKCGIEYARTTHSTENFFLPENFLELNPTCHHNNPKLMELAKIFIENKDSSYKWANYPLMFYVWGHSYEFNNQDNWNVIEDFFKYVSFKDDVWYATNIEIIRYVKAFDSLIYSADGKFIYNPSSTDVYTSYFNKNVLIPKGQTVKVDV